MLRAVASSTPRPTRRMAHAMRLVAVFAWAAGVVAVAGAQHDNNTWDVEAFPSELHDHHVVIVSLCVGVSSLALLAAVIYAATGRGIRLAYLVLAVSTFAVVAVGVTAWVVTYMEARNVIHQKAERMLQYTAQIVEVVDTKLSLGPEMTSAMTLMYQSGQVDFLAKGDLFAKLAAIRMLERGFPREHVDLVYYGVRADGRFYAKGTGEHEDAWHGADWATVDTGGCFRCAPVDTANATVCNATRDAGGCGGNGSGSAACAATCGAPPAQAHCEGSGGTTLAILRGDWPNAWTLNCSATAGGPIAYDPRVRPWFVSAPLFWTDPYLFAGLNPAVGFTVSSGLRRPLTGEWVATVAVDFSLSTVATLLRESPPTPNAVIVLLQPNGLVLSASVTHARLGEDLGVDVSKNVANVSEARPGSQVRRMAETASQYFGGTLAGAVGKKAIIVEGETLLTVSSLAIDGGLDVLVFVYLPYTDLLGETNDASTVALLLAMGICAVFVLLLAGILLVVTRPLEHMAQGMDKIAWMRLSEVPVQPQSAVYELQWMQRSFEKMTQNLEEFRTYLPASMLEADSVIESDVESEDGFVTSSGIAALVFTDVVKSSDSWQRCPAGMRVGLRKHNDIIRKLIDEHAGYEVKTVGDAFMVSFEGEQPAQRAARFALGVHERLLQADWPPELCELPQNARTPDGAWCGLRVRIGVHVGEVDIETNRDTGRRDFFGPTVNKAARMESNGIAGSVNVTDEILEQVAPMMEDLKNAKKLDMGVIDLKGVGHTRCTLLYSEPLKMRVSYYEEFMKAKLVANGTGADIPTLAKIGRGSNSRLSSGRSRNPHSGQALGVGVVLDRFKQRLARIPCVAIGMIELRLVEGFLDEWTDPLLAINESLSVISVILKRTAGSLSTVLGAGIAVHWGIARRDSAQRVVENAVKCGQLLRCLNRSDKTAAGHLGVCVGPCVHGNIGMAQKFVTTIGPAVSVATQLAQVAADLPCQFLATSLMGDFQSLGSQTVMQGCSRPVDRWVVRSPPQTLVVYEVRGGQRVSTRNVRDMNDALEKTHSMHFSGSHGFGETGTPPPRSPRILLGSQGTAGSPTAVQAPEGTVHPLMSDNSGSHLHNGASPALSPVAGMSALSNELSGIRLRINNAEEAWGWSQAYTDAFNVRDYVTIVEHCHPDDDPVGYNVGERGGRALRGPFGERAL